MFTVRKFLSHPKEILSLIHIRIHYTYTTTIIITTTTFTITIPTTTTITTISLTAVATVLLLLHLLLHDKKTPIFCDIYVNKLVWLLRHKNGSNIKVLCPFLSLIVFGETLLGNVTNNFTAFMMLQDEILPSFHYHLLFFLPDNSLTHSQHW